MGLKTPGCPATEEETERKKGADTVETGWIKGQMLRNAGRKWKNWDIVVQNKMEIAGAFLMMKRLVGETCLEL